MSVLLRNYEIVSNPYEHLQHLEWNDTLAVAVSLETVKNDELFSRLNIICFNAPNRIYEYPLKILAKKRFAHLVKLNRFLELASEAGLIVKWLKGFNFDMSEKEPLYEYAEVEVEIFFILGVITTCLHIIAILLIILEWKTFMKIHTQTNARAWQLIDKMIDSDRYFLKESLYDINTKNG